MLNDVIVFNIHEYLSAKSDNNLGENELRQLISEFFCDKNSDVERFLKEQSIEFTKKFDIKEAKSETEASRTLVQLLESFIISRKGAVQLRRLLSCVQMYKIHRLMVIEPPMQVILHERSFCACVA